ncbi:hypothetical protein P344_01080 [Spiroplasma mirum ATCC 29335]|uniref:C4-dicarboxylate ABC transporter n=1 Tax=Spiroplasma mirum ATCC 29335 TaxID=838561 RepID=W0GNK3_9MOLU|nr:MULTISPECIES: YfcC family protein [Spiroplasma]AHF60633.1 arginine-ornithine antiporter [Spiroplasma mirum ATCC 29335]AHI57583.1 hypothetical protein P344_01080 [Spiroplasma mirum ATCC 29335]AKM52779.1 arginine/ornithine antiporter [Spiroplasma atrichopogonis]
MPALKSGKRRKFKLPAAITILFFIIAIVIIVSWIPGTAKPYDPVTGQYGKAGVFELFLAPLEGFGGKLDTILFVLVLGGFLNVIIKSEALGAGIGRLIVRMKGKEIWIIPTLMFLFSIGGTTYGMGEETIALYPVLIPVMLAARFDVVTSVMTILLGAGVGCVGSFLNPFVIGVSFSRTDTATFGITNSAGIIWRIIAWLVLTAVTIAFVMWYAMRVRKNPEKSPMYTEREFYLKEFGMPDSIPEFTKKRKAIMIVFMLTFIVMIFSLVSWSSFGYNAATNANDWIKEHAPYIARFFSPFGDFSLLQVAVVFLISSIVIVAIDWKGEEEYVRTFIAGASDILSVCLVIATAAGIGWILNKTGMQINLVNVLASPMKKLVTTGFIIVGFFFFLIISIFIPSTSGFAAAVFPIIGPVAEGIQPGLWSGSITAFSFANGIINLVSPTSFILMAALSISKVSLDKYLKVVWPYLIGLTALAIVLLAIGSQLPIKPGGMWF